MATRLEDYRERKTSMHTDARMELKNNGVVFHPNLFVEITDEGVKIWSEDGGSVVIPDDAIKSLKSRLTWMTGSVT